MFSALRSLFVGKAKSPHDTHVFHRLSLIAFLAWVGLGADGLSSSCYGPEEAFLALGEHKYLGIFVALLSALTIFLISASYSQIIELFPGGGGGYLVASKLINPTVGMVSGCALIIDYVLTIAISIASGADAFFSFLPPDWLGYKLGFALAGTFLLMWMNVRGVKESVVPLAPIFMVFVLTHAFAIIYTLVMHAPQLPQIAATGAHEVQSVHSQVGWAGVIFLILRAFSLGAGTFTGIEAVSNGLPILRDPKVETGKKTMRYMAFSLAFTVVGLMFAYLLLDVHKTPGKTLNASLFEVFVHGWPTPWGGAFVLIALVSESTLLFVAAQAGFIDGPRVLANMALDRWVPTRFSSLSDRLVTQNGIVLMGIAGLAALLLTKGNVGVLVILYSINVFITFCLSQAGMVRHWWVERGKDPRWGKKLFVNGLGLSLTTFILCSVVILKFNEGGWITMIVTAAAALLAYGVKNHYKRTARLLGRLDPLVDAIDGQMSKGAGDIIKPDPNSRTAVILVNGYNGLGMHTLLGVFKTFGREFKNFVFVQVGVIDAGNFKGAQELDKLEGSVQKDLGRYTAFMNKNGYYAESFYSLGIDLALEVEGLSQRVVYKHPGCVFFGGQLVFPKETFMDRLLHNFTVFAIQKRLYQRGIPFMILPVRV